ncbi:MAG: S8 family serine peptidase [Bacteroidales bacterium]|nr:S8 family serine peptidase [Bacteroidales bacterium]
MKNIFASILICLFVSGSAQQIAPVFHEFEEGVVYFRITDQYDVSHIPLTEDYSVDPALLPELTGIFEVYGMISLSRPVVAFDHPVLLRIFRMQFSYTSAIDRLIDELQAQKEIIKYAEKNPNKKPLYRPNDPFYGNVNNANFKWHLDRIHAEGAWMLQQGTPNIKVAIVDNFVWGEHPDLNIATANQYNVYNSTEGNSSPPAQYNQLPTDTSYENSHGTHVAGLVGAINNNNIGIASIGGGVTLMGVRASTNNGDLYNTAQGISWAVKNGAKVINMSYGSSYSLNYERETFQTYANAGVILVASAGNNGHEGNPARYPANYNSVISVASIDGDENLSYFSEYGDTNADIAAPGGFINSSRSNPNMLSTTFCESYMLRGAYPSLANTHYDGMQGTSMSSPMVAGLCGLLLSFDSTLTPAQMKSLLQQTASPLNPNSPTKIGTKGYVNAFAALMSLNANVPIFKVSSQTLNCPYNEYSDSILVISHQAWTLKGNIPAWMTATINDYHGESKRIVFHIDKNFSIYPRSCELSVYSAALDSTIKITISQLAHPKTVEVDKNIIRINREQNSVSLLSITSNVHWSINDSLPSWLTISSSSGDTSQIITFTAKEENTLDSNRSFSFTLSGDGVPDTTLTVIQYFQNLNFSIDKEIINLGSSNRAIDTLWITSNTDWGITGYDTSLISIFPTSGYGNGYVVIRSKTTNSNYTPSTTTGLFYLNGIDSMNIFISQRASDFLLLTENTFTLGSTKESTITVPVYSNVAWKIYASGNPSWIAPNITEGQDSVNIVFTALESNETEKIRSIKYNVHAIFSLQSITIVQDFSNDISSKSSEKESIQVYPNPVNDFVEISVKNHLIKQIRILEIPGNIIQTVSSIEEPQSRINFSDLSAGIYILQITLNDNTVITKKITKQ